MTDDSKQPDPVPDVTMLLQAVREGDSQSSDALLEAVYSELRSLARSRMHQEKAGQTLQATALVHEAWIRLGGSSGDWSDRRHFFGAASRAMRQILVERHRRVSSLKRGGDMDRVDDLDPGELQAVDGVGDLDLVALDQALTELQEQDPRMAEIVELRYFGGLSVEDTAKALELSPRTVKREWAVARGWLFQRLGGSEGD